MDVQRRNAPGVLYLRIERDIIIVTRQAFALRVNAKAVRNVVAHFVTPRAAKTGSGRRMAIEFLPAIAGEIVTTQEVLVLVARGGVHVLRNDIPAWPAHRFALRRCQRGHHSAGVLERSVVHQIVTQDAVFTADSIGKPARTRVEQNARGFKSARGQHYNFGSDFASHMRSAIDERHSVRLAFGVHHQMAHHGIAHQMKTAGARRGRQRNGRAIEIGRGEAAALAFVAIMASWTAVEWNGEVGGAVDNQLPSEFLLDNFLRGQLAATQPHSRKKLAVGQLRQIFGRSADADKILNAIVIRFEILVAEGPILAVAVIAGGLEFEIAVAIANAGPTKSLAAHLPSANPHERLVGRKCIRMVVVIDEKLVAVIVAGIAEPLHGLVFE